MMYTRKLLPATFLQSLTPRTDFAGSDNSLIQTARPGTGSASASWFHSWFDSADYHKLYAKRNTREAEQFIDAILDMLQPAAGSAMLDIGCGTGRHSKYLADRGFQVTGFDLSANSIREARVHESPTLHFYQYDMRKPFGRNKFDFAFNFFTSFGYFHDDRENFRVVQNMSDALKPGGRLLIDYLNVDYTEQHLVPVDDVEIDGIIYHINRWTDHRWIYKRIEIPGQGHAPEIHREQVAKFRLEDFQEFCSAAGLEIEDVYGDYELNP
ncbi:MAG TPA: class I SAM-dependent methyltransferase, partial [Flavitalea sp.]|nr:class I SAM-dependent methyltransferase [Flavitalea sp.]